jgi:hypothetical protein
VSGVTAPALARCSWAACRQEPATTLDGWPLCAAHGAEHLLELERTAPGLDAFDESPPTAAEVQARAPRVPRRLTLVPMSGSVALAYTAARGWHLLSPPPPWWIEDQDVLVELDEEGRRRPEQLFRSGRPPRRGRGAGTGPERCCGCRGALHAGVRRRRSAGRRAGPATGRASAGTSTLRRDGHRDRSTQVPGNATMSFSSSLACWTARSPLELRSMLPHPTGPTGWAERGDGGHVGVGVSDTACRDYDLLTGELLLAGDVERRDAPRERRVGGRALLPVVAGGGLRLRVQAGDLGVQVHS